MICCKECLDLLYDYLEGVLDPKVSSDLKEHFEDCPPCIAFLETYKTATKICRDTLKKVEIPEEVQASLRSFLNEHIRKT